MATMENVPVSAASDFDPDNFGEDSGAIPLTGLTHDIDGDGILDTVIFDSGHSVVIASDMDSDGSADHLTMIQGSGEYASWEFRRDSEGVVHWEQTDDGILGGR